MVVMCIVRGCKSEWHPGCDIIFHSFPSNAMERNKWLNIVKLNRPFFEKAKICNRHFKPTDYMVTGKRLRQGVTPSSYEVADCPLEQLDEEYTTSVAAKQIQETTCMIDMPSCSHESWPLRNITKENLNVPLCKKPRLLQYNLETEKEDMNKDDTSISKIIIHRGTSPIQIFCADKSIQTRIKSSREEALMRRNKILVQKVCMDKCAELLTPPLLIHV